MSATKKERVALCANKDVIALQRGYVFLETTEPTTDWDFKRRLVATVQANLMTYRHMLDKDASTMMTTASVDEILAFNNNVMEYLKFNMGGKKQYEPLYKNFPDEVMSAEDETLFSNACIHYLSVGQWAPETPVLSRPIEFEPVKYTVLKDAMQEDFSDIFTKLVSINQSLTPQDLEVVKWFVEKRSDLVIWPDAIPFKENLCTLAAMKVDGLPVKTTTDVLRIAVGMSGGDISLPSMPPKQIRPNRWSRAMADNPKRLEFQFKKFSRSERRYLMQLLEATNCDTKEMVLKLERWKRLGEIVHPGEYKDRFPKAAAAFDRLRNYKVKSWYGILAEAFQQGLEQGLEVLAQRPGEFIRRIDWLVRTNQHKFATLDIILRKFRQAAVGASNKVLYELYGHIQKRKDPVKNRTIMVKGARKKTVLPDLPAISNSAIIDVESAILDVLKAKFSKLEPLGKVWIDDELMKIPLPTNLRSMNFSTKPVIRGQRIPLDNKDAKVVRCFVQWTNEEHKTTDIDLSCTFVREDGTNSVLSFSTAGLKVGKSCHSGDITHRLGNNAEYIDIAVADAKANGFRYCVMDVRNFSGRGLRDVGALFGVMEREKPSSNTHWLPETVVATTQMESEATNTLVSMVDLETMEYIYLDIDSAGAVTAQGDAKNTLEMVKQYSELPNFSVYHLLSLHAQARGTQVVNREEADRVFTFDEFSTSYEKTGAWMGV